MLEKIPNKGFIVKEFKEKEKLDTYEVIGVLDSLAGSLSMEYLTPEEINKMEELAEMMEISIKYKNHESYLKIDNEFHSIYRNKCDNQVLLASMYNLIYNFMPKSYISENEEELFKMLGYSNKQHLKLVEAFRDLDKKQIESLLKDHWKTRTINEMK